MAVDLQVASDARSLPSADEIVRCVERTLAIAGAPGDVSVAIRIVDETEMRRLNREYRQQDRPTNVLAFPAGDLQGLPPGEPRPLGDIVVCAGVVSRQATEQGKASADHWSHMLVHGTLHLLGYDHVSERDAEQMEGLERSILAGIGIADPYQGN